MLGRRQRPNDIPVSPRVGEKSAESKSSEGWPSSKTPEKLVLMFLLELYLEEEEALRWMGERRRKGDSLMEMRS